MGGIRLGGIVFIPLCSPPFGAIGGTDTDGSPNIYRSCVGDTAGAATLYTDFTAAGGLADDTFNPVISPDGTSILFNVRSPATGYFEIWVVDNQPGSTPTLVLDDVNTYLTAPAWHPDSDQFTYWRGSGAGAFSGGTIEKSSVSDPGTVVVLKSSSGTQSPMRPQFNFDGSRIAYMYDNNIGTGGELRVMDDDGTNDISLDTGVRYLAQGPQFSWANTMNVIAYDDGQSGTNAAYVINDDATGKTQINANGVGAGAGARVSDRAWPVGDGYVVYSGFLGLVAGLENPVRAELDGSNTTTLNASHGPWNQDYFNKVIVADNHLWWIEDGFKLAGCSIDGSNYVLYLTMDGGAMNAPFGSGTGWFYQ
jgi:hypothetical protein